MFSSRARQGVIAGFAGTVDTVGAIAALLAPRAGASPPSPPPGCAVVVNTPAAVTGAPQAQANKSATFDRLCLPQGLLRRATRTAVGVPSPFVPLACASPAIRGLRERAIGRSFGDHRLGFGAVPVAVSGRAGAGRGFALPPSFAAAFSGRAEPVAA
jgi:hypothetical protein